LKSHFTHFFYNIIFNPFPVYLFKKPKSQKYKRYLKESQLTNEISKKGEVIKFDKEVKREYLVLGRAQPGYPVIPSKFFLVAAS